MVMRAAWARFGLLLVLTCVFAACSGGGGGGEDEPSGNWDELVWDEGSWQ
jgi:hypothetical protein